MTEHDMELLAGYCKALGHPTRVLILRKLVEIDRCTCGSIVDQLPLAQSTVSAHLKVLKEAGLVDGEVEGPKTRYCVDHGALAELERLLEKLGRPIGALERITNG
ncbi:ArsR/SmtB family transcription factor [Salidesulfovibrio brasiliensis]|uniref:ArsR/SmtB family transcription factor n=1 Tax=Salidesulfovibrio brasiliensis TaxID=221711 RepID=UPI000AB34F2B|nr:metalloregulator ArsR/SmtB family transcription factor [Salidesulfovibrio brasiliensis]